MDKHDNHFRLQTLVSQRHWTRRELRDLRDEVFREVIRRSDQISNGNFKVISNEDLGILFHAIDDYFFDGCVASVCEQESSKPLSFRLSTRMTTSGGMTTMQQTRGRRPKREFEIAIATTPLFETYKLDANACVGGIVCQNRLEALQRIMEHEMVHLIELLLWNRSNCSANPFREIIRRIFGHVESHHQLLTPQDVALKRLGIRTGDKVQFEFQGSTLQGFVNRISKRATVLVSCPSGVRYNDGVRYQKYYVPLNHLRPVNKSIKKAR